MPTPWITALRIFNEGSPSWCIPRKDTPSYKMVQRIRMGDEVKTPKQLREELEKKTAKPKKVRRSVKIDLKK